MANVITSNIERRVLGDRFISATPSHPLNQIPTAALDPIGSFSGYQYDADGFVTYAGPSTGETAAGGWLIGETGTSVVGIEADSDGGVLKIASGGVDDNCTVLQRVGDVWKYVVGKRLWCFARFNLSDANLGEAVFGLFPTTAAASMDTIAELIALDDGIFFEKAVAATEFDFHVRKNDVSTEATLVSSTFADGTYRVLGFVVDVAGNVKAYDGTSLDNLTEVASV